MRRLCFGLLTLLWLVLLPAIGAAAELVPVPALSTRVTDLTASLDATQKGRLEAQLAAIERARGAQIAVLMLPSTQPEAIEQFGIRLAEAWKIGHKGADNGVIVIVAKADRKMRIEVGYGLEGAIPDAVAKRIVAERMAPAFKQGDFFGGLRAAIEGLDQAIGGPGSAAPAAEPLRVDSGKSSGKSAEDTDLSGWIMAAAVAGGVLRMMFGLLGALAAAFVAGWLGLVMFGSWLAALLAGLAIFVLAFLSPLFLGGFGGGSGGSSSGGGFSGGGGSFGGGGASGNW